MNTLIIIGNGFDLAHNLPTTYFDFEKFLSQNEKYQDFYNKLTKYISPDILWSSFEDALGCLDEDMLQDDCTTFLQSYGDEDWSDSGHGDYQYMIQEELSFSSKIPIYLKEWIEKVDQDYPCEKINLPIKFDNNSLFISFNYTLTLEKAYGIKKENIIYIHENINSQNELITGHDNKKSYSFTEYDYEGDIRVIEGKQIINEYFESTFKNTDSISNNYMNFFESLGNINKVIILGHSLSKIDRHYFKIIKNNISKDANWIISYHTEKNNISDFINEINIFSYEKIKI
ncbi:bacteriophage abortive infection AbiH family protein [Pasteurella sp. PK-2025]|uniref:bacteriophage abortive infection AbiH family protein n=1 Tax=Pasteurella sp. PK-2025 TaxID=3413133 RepID=UPI003C7307AF